jgi:hypothetical protein
MRIVDMFITRMIGALAAMSIAVSARAARAEGEALKGPVVAVHETAEARGCPGVEELNRELAREVPEAFDATRAVIEIRVSLERSGDAWSAELDVSGRRRGVRRLEARGPDCAELARLLVASLAVVVDDEHRGPEREAFPVVLEETGPEDENPKAPPEPAEAANPAPAPDRPATLEDVPPWLLRERRPERRASGWASAGGGLSVALGPKPLGLGAAGFLTRLGGVEAGVFGFASTQARREVPPGELRVSFYGAFFRGCFPFASLGSDAALAACALGALAALRAEALEFPSNAPPQTLPWYAAGPALVAHGSMGLPWGWEASLGAFAPLRRQTLLVEGLGEVFETPPLAIWLSFSLRLAVF